MLPGTDVDVVIVGAGFSGIGMAVQLERRGRPDFVVLERGDDVGGTWRDNVYPGAACDIPSDVYSFSFAPDSAWSHRYGSQPEILSYLRRVADRSGVRSRIRFGTELLAARWTGRHWAITTSTGRLTARALVSGQGPLIDPVWPAVPGLDRFGGPLLHTARWDPAAELAGRRVGVIGTGASAIQLVPELQRAAGHVDVFQRTAPWVVPRRNPATSARRRALLRRFPALQRAARAAAFLALEARHPAFRHPLIGRIAQAHYRRFLRRQLPDATLRAAATAPYRLGCKRILISSDYYPALARDNVELVTSAITGVEADAVITADGRRHPVDVLVAATGFDATHPRIAERVFDADGRSLAAAWAGGMSALRGTTVAGFPNLFLLIGPNTALGHNSLIHILESQLGYVADLLGRSDVVEPTAVAQARWDARMQRRLGRSVWQRGGCSSYYRDEHGRNTTLWPGTALGFRMAARVHAAEFR